DGRDYRVQWTPEVDCHRFLEVALAHVLDWADLDDARVVDQHVDGTHPVHRVRDQSLRLVPAAHVARGNLHLSAARCEIVARALQLRPIARGYRDERPQAAKLASDEQAQAARPAR